MKKTCLLRIMCALLFAAMFPSPAFATERADIVTGLNALPFLINKISGNITVAVVYDPANAASRIDAENIKQIIDAGLEVPGGAKLSAILVSPDGLGKLSRAQIAFLTAGLTDHFSEINIATSAASILTISTDLTCVKMAKCVLGVVTKPAIAVYFNKTAADAAKIEFSQAFSMLVKEF